MSNNYLGTTMHAECFYVYMQFLIAVSQAQLDCNAVTSTNSYSQRRIRIRRSPFKGLTLNIPWSRVVSAYIAFAGSTTPTAPLSEALSQPRYSYRLATREGAPSRPICCVGVALVIQCGCVQRFWIGRKTGASTIQEALFIRNKAKIR